MATPNTTVSSSGIGDDTTQAVYSRAVLEAYRGANVFRRAADIRWAQGEPMPGISVTFTILNALAAATSALSETADPTPVTITDTQKTITLVEYGNTVKTTEKWRATTFINGDLTIPREVAANMEQSLDEVAGAALVAGTNVIYVGQTSRAAITAANTLTGNHLRRARTELRSANTPSSAGVPMDNYIGIIHPDVSYDLQVETGQAAWSAPQVYREGQEGIWSGEIGRFGGIVTVENASAVLLNANAGSGTTVDVYYSVFYGANALGEAIGTPQQIRITGPFDDLGRFVAVGWYALEGFGRLREDSLLRIESASSLGTNT